MSSRTLQIVGLKPAQLQALARKAKRQGTTPREYVRQLIEKDLGAGKAFDEILKPMRDGFAKSGITPEELDRVVDQARSATISKRRRRSYCQNIIEIK